MRQRCPTIRRTSFRPGMMTHRQRPTTERSSRRAPAAKPVGIGRVGGATGINRTQATEGPYAAGAPRSAGESGAVMTFRRIVFWAHLSAAVAVGLVILLMSATGVLLAYERQIVAGRAAGVRGAAARGTPARHRHARGTGPRRARRKGCARPRERPCRTREDDGRPREPSVPRPLHRCGDRRARWRRGRLLSPRSPACTAGWRSKATPEATDGPSRARRTSSSCSSSCPGRSSGGRGAGSGRFSRPNSFSGEGCRRPRRGTTTGTTCSGSGRSCRFS